MWAASAAKLGFRWKIENGRKVKFWKDNWLGHSSLAIQFWDVYVSEWKIEMEDCRCSGVEGGGRRRAQIGLCRMSGSSVDRCVACERAAPPVSGSGSD
jgi:hypothetical protein